MAHQGNGIQPLKGTKLCPEVDKPPKPTAREARPRRSALVRLHLHETSRAGASTEAESSPVVAWGLEGAWGETADGHRVYFRETKMTWD